MSLLTGVLYGDRLYDEPTYSANNDPESLSLSLSDTATLSETLADSINKVLADTQSMTEALTTSGIKALSDSSTMVDTLIASLNFARYDSVTLSDATIFSAIKVLADAFSVTDSLVVLSSVKQLSESVTIAEQRLFQLHTVLADTLVLLETRAMRLTKGLTDFIILNEWITIVLNKANIWTTQSAQADTNEQNVLYSVPEYAEDVYSANPVVTWQKGDETSVFWTPPTTHEESLPLYSQNLYSQTLYGSMPVINWNDQQSEVEENFTNFDGEGNVP